MSAGFTPGGGSTRVKAESGASMKDYIGRKLTVTLSDNREMTGRFVCYDRHMNVVLDDVSESRRGKKGTQERQLGLVLVRGEHVRSVTASRVDRKQQQEGQQVAAGASVAGAAAVPSGDRRAPLPGAAGKRRDRDEE
jgi:small nuclear ribonucleoprotein (snRNP)-like protein